MGMVITKSLMDLRTWEQAAELGGNGGKVLHQSGGILLPECP